MGFERYYKQCLVGTALVLFFALFIVGWRLVLPVNIGFTEPVSFVVNRGEGMVEIARRLHQDGLIKSAKGFIVYILASGSAAELKPGVYRLSPSFSAIRIARMLTQGAVAVKVVIQEGSTVVDIDRLLAAEGIIRAGDLIAHNNAQDESLEGFLFPDTYIFSAGSSVKTIIKAMTDAFEKQMGPLLAGRTRAEWYPDLILASLIEKEALYPRDQFFVSDVLRRRLAIGMPLQVDAVNVYIKCDGAYMTCPASSRVLSKNDLTMENPYNTYLYRGLPPTPIANPGRDAMIAALNPEKNHYFYYISNPRTGRLVFAATLDEHNENRRIYH